MDSVLRVGVAALPPPLPLGLTGGHHLLHFRLGTLFLGSLSKLESWPLESR